MRLAMWCQHSMCRCALCSTTVCADEMHCSSWSRAGSAAAYGSVPDALSAVLLLATGLCVPTRPPCCATSCTYLELS